MVRTYKAKNPTAHRSRLPAEATLGIVYNYLCQVDAKELAQGLSTTEPTIHRMIARVQQRLGSDRYLLSALSGLLVEGPEFLEPHADVIAALTSDIAVAEADVARCIYRCPQAVSLTYETFQAYIMNSDEEIDGGFVWPELNRDDTFTFRKDRCAACPNPLPGDASIWSVASFNEVLEPKRRRHLMRHLPAMIVRSSARLRLHRALEDGYLYEEGDLGGVETNFEIRDEIIRKWLASAVPYLKNKPFLTHHPARNRQP